MTLPPLPTPVLPPSLRQPFFSGIAGSGMSALALYLAMQKVKVTGSDRSLDEAPDLPIALALKQQAIELVPQNGEGVKEQHSCLVVSTAIEGNNPEIKKANQLGLPILHRSDVLHLLTQQKKSIAVAGTSGKSTVTAMIFEILKQAHQQPSLITGAALASLQKEGLWGNAYYDTGEWIVFEADESDGTLIKYHPDRKLLLNIDKDHKELDELLTIFNQYINSPQGSLIAYNKDPLIQRVLKQSKQQPTISYNINEIKINSKVHKIEQVQYENWSTKFQIENLKFLLKVPGAHNLTNAVAALSTCLSIGVSLADCAQGLKNYQGIERRFQWVGHSKGLLVIDDFAHNPVKIKACLQTAKEMIKRSPELKRLVAIFHPHGFAPMKLMMDDLVDELEGFFDSDDLLLLPEIYYVGGTADQSVSSHHFIERIKPSHKNSFFFETKPLLLQFLKEHTQSGDLIVSMGARDPHLKQFAREILN